MNVVGLITEYNPFHNGHKYHIEEARRITGADFCIAVMSGNFVQRGAPAIIDKYSRTQMALNNGVDLVLELPVCYATGSAEFFAHGAVSILDGLGITDYLCFGSEAGDIGQLQAATSMLLDTPASFDEKLKTCLKEGLNYPAARQKAMEALLEPQAQPLSSPADSSLIKLLAEPNNILGIEYLKAIRNLSASIKPVTIQREAAHYHDTALSGNSSCPFVPEEAFGPVISSATAIRGVINQEAHPTDHISEIKSSVPANVYQLLEEQYQKTSPVTEDDFLSILQYKLLAKDQSALTQYLDISADLADRMKNTAGVNCSYAELASRLKTKNLTLTRINRALFHLLLNIRTDELATYKMMGYTSYARILGIRRDASRLLRSIQDNSRIPVITKVSQARKILDATQLRMLSGDIFAAHLYNQAVYAKYHTSLADEYRHGIVIL